MRIAKSLKEAVPMGPEHVCDLIRQKLSVALFKLEEGRDPTEVIKELQAALGMDDFPVLVPPGL